MTTGDGGDSAAGDATADGAVADAADDAAADADADACPSNMPCRCLPCPPYGCVFPDVCDKTVRV
jgi:hypothetical protein